MLAVAFLILALFFRLASMVVSGAAASLDSPIREQVHNWVSPLFTSVMQGFTFAGSDVFMGLLCLGALAWLLRQGRGRDATILAVAFAVAELLTEAAKRGFQRSRPEPFFGLETPDSYSFPSGHALKSAVLYILLAMLATEKISVRLGAAAIALLVGLSRIYLGVHYPTDVLGGFALAAFCLLAVAAYRRMPV